MLPFTKIVSYRAVSLVHVSKALKSKQKIRSGHIKYPPLRGNSSIVKKLSKRSFFVKKLCVLTLTFWQKKSHQKRVSRHAPIWHLLTAHLPMDICCPDILTRPGNLQIHWSTKDIHPFSAFFAPPLPLCPLSIHSRLNPLRRKSYSPRPPFLKIFWSIFFCNIFKKSFVLW